MIRPVCRMGHPILRSKARDLTKDYLKTDEFAGLISDLKDSMDHYGGIGIAAPQIGIGLNVAIIEIKGSGNRYGEAITLPLTVFVNPRIKKLTDDEQGFWEGCLSVPGLRGYVERPKKIQVNFLDAVGEEKELIAEGFLATVIQHELDHLEGILYIDRVRDSRMISYQEEFEQFIQARVLD